MSGQPEEMLRGSLQWASSSITSRLETGIACSTAVFTIVKLGIKFGTYTKAEWLFSSPNSKVF